MNRQRNLKLTLVCVGIFILACAIIVKLVCLQIIAGSRFTKIAASQHTYVVELPGRRGDVFDSQGVTLASTMPSYSLYALPKKISDKDNMSTRLSQITGVPRDRILDRLNRDKSFVWIKRQLNKSERQSIEDMGLDCVGFIKEPKRFYPQEELACQVLGIVDIDNKGLEGLELNFDEFLRAKQGKAILLRDSHGRVLPLYKELIYPRDGFNLVLNIDSHIQHWASFFLGQTVEETKAKGGSVVVLNPQDGRVLALCNWPKFDPNQFLDFPRQNFRNKAVVDFYEPGSVFKVVTLVAALAEKPGLERESFFCEEGELKIPGSTLHDWKKFGTLSFQDVFKNSSNIGVAKVANAVGDKIISKYMNIMGFGRLTGIDLPTETSGFVKPLASWSKTSRFIMPIGQEVCVSLLQLARAFSIVANGGYLIKPYIVDKIVDNKGVVIKDFKPRIESRVLPESVADKAKQILWKVVEEGTGRRAKIEGINIAGKTGTSQKIEPSGGYSHRDFYATFVGFFPVEDPRYVIAVVVDEPRTYYYGGMVAAPLFRNIAQKIVEYKNLIKVESRE
ncbi:MAG: penicillin-binding protein 2 [Candidatus Omnitrophica bacterium]|nr:penicillin-binding protein 2 [Candidatus Omnitrophota bacterium]